MSASILKKTYLEKAVPNLKESLGFKSNMAVPKITKVTLNMGLGPDAVNDRKVIDTAIEDLRLISGQQPVKTLVRKSVASFKIRDGYPYTLQSNPKRGKNVRFSRQALEYRNSKRKRF